MLAPLLWWDNVASQSLSMTWPRYSVLGHKKEHLRCNAADSSDSKQHVMHKGLIIVASVPVDFSSSHQYCTTGNEASECLYK